MPATASRPSCRVLAQSAVAVAHTGTTSKTTLATVTVPAGAMRANSALRVTVLWSATNNANVKTGTVEIGGTWAPQQTLTSLVSSQSQWVLRNRGAVNGQVAHNSINPTTSGALLTPAIDFASAQSLIFTATLANAADTMTLEAYTVEILN